MDNAEFMGTFMARSDALKASFPEENESGLWQAWKMPDGDFIVQPLDMLGEPTGSLSMMHAEDFSYSLAPLPSDDEIAAVGKHFLRANSPDLLDVWYEQAKSQSGATNRNTGLFYHAQHQALSPEGAGASTDVHTMQDIDPASLEVLKNALDSVAADSPRQDKPAAWIASEGLQVEMESFDADAAPKTDLPSLFSGTEDDTPAGDTGQEEIRYWAGQHDSDADEARAVVMEKAMRTEFTTLIEQLDESSYPAVEKELEQLLSRGIVFTWKQKFMFSEFGMALRRKGKPHLALMAHERALGLAPGDGHILFNLARTQYELGDIPAARVYLEQALNILPDFVPAQNFLIFLNGQQEKS